MLYRVIDTGLRWLYDCNISWCVGVYVCTIIYLLACRVVKFVLSVEN